MDQREVNIKHFSQAKFDGLYCALPLHYCIYLHGHTITYSSKCSKWS